MNKYHIALTLAGIFLVVLLYQLPITAVNNEEPNDLSSHSFDITKEDAGAITSLKRLVKEEVSENYFNFADSLASLYLRYGFLDSANDVTLKILLRDSSLQRQKKAAEILYASFERASNMKDANAYAREARKVLVAILEKETDNLSVKTKLAMTLVTTENPMSGIMMLREVIDVDPINREALLSLGLLSIQSGQYDKALERFEKLLDLEANDYEAMLYLGVCYLETNKKDKAKLLFANIKAAENADPSLKVAAEEYLKN
jgi:outer membrane protein